MGRLRPVALRVCENLPDMFLLHVFEGLKHRICGLSLNACGALQYIVRKGFFLIALLPCTF
jgi:hypothetical protein